MTNQHPIFIVHGFRGNPLFQAPLESKLRSYGFKRVHRVGYPSLNLTIDDCREYLANQIKRKLGSHNEDIVVIAHSMGGIVCRELHDHGLNIKMCFMVATPQRGSYLAKYIRDKFKPGISDYILGKGGEDLTNVQGEVNPPPFPYWTIGTSLPVFSTFDGVVFSKNMVIEDDRHIHFPNSHHSIIILDSRVHKFILSKLNAPPKPPKRTTSVSLKEKKSPPPVPTRRIKPKEPEPVALKVTEKKIE